jgi:hypothetical protein
MVGAFVCCNGKLAGKCFGPYSAPLGEYNDQQRARALNLGRSQCFLTDRFDVSMGVH